MWSNLALSVSALHKRNISNKFHASFSSSSEAAATRGAAQRGVGGNIPAASYGKSDARHENLFSRRQLKLGHCMAPLAARLPSVCKPTLMHAQLNHNEYTEEMLDPALIMRLVCGSHRCQNMLDVNGTKVICNYQLWGIENSEAIENLAQQRKRFLAQPDKARGMEATRGLHCAAISCCCASASAANIKQRVVKYLVGPNDALLRR
eukprot:4402580-Pleurochrysis_carterae.AAC.1